MEARKLWHELDRAYFPRCSADFVARNFWRSVKQSSRNTNPRIYLSAIYYAGHSNSVSCVSWQFFTACILLWTETLEFYRNYS